MYLFFAAVLLFVLCVVAQIIIMRDRQFSNDDNFKRLEKQVFASMINGSSVSKYEDWVNIAALRYERKDFEAAKAALIDAEKFHRHVNYRSTHSRNYCALHNRLTGSNGYQYLEPLGPDYLRLFYE